MLCANACIWSLACVSRSDHSPAAMADHPNAAAAAAEETVITDDNGSILGLELEGSKDNGCGSRPQMQPATCHISLSPFCGAAHTTCHISLSPFCGEGLQRLQAAAHADCTAAGTPVGTRVWAQVRGFCYWPGVTWALELCPKSAQPSLLRSFRPGKCACVALCISGAMHKQDFGLGTDA
jgi:hypothetical protein